MTAVDFLTLRVLLQGDDSHLNGTLVAADKAIDDFIKKPWGSVNVPPIRPVVDPTQANQAIASLQTRLNTLRTPTITPQINTSAANQQLSGLEQRIQRLQNSGYRQLRAGTILTTSITAPLISAGTEVTRYVMDLEASMAHTAALTEIGRKGIEEYKNRILDLARDRRVIATPKELGDAFFFAASKTKSGADAMGVLKASAIAAAAGLGETKDVVEGVTTVLNAYKLGGDRASHVTDVFVQSAKEGGVAADTFAKALPKVVSTAAGMGISIEQVAASIATMTRIGIPAANAATALNRLLFLMEKPPKGAQEAVAKLHLSFAQLRAEAQEKGLLEVLEKIFKAGGDKMEALAPIFTSINSFKVLMATAGTQAQTYEHILGKMFDAQGAAAEANATAMGTFSNQLAHLKGVAAATAIEIGEKLLPTLTGIADTAGQNLPAAVDRVVKSFEALPDPIKRALIDLTALVALAGPVNMLAGNATLLVAAFGHIYEMAVGGLGVIKLVAAFQAARTAITATGLSCVSLIGAGGVLTTLGAALGGLVITAGLMGLAWELLATETYKMQAAMDDAANAVHNDKMAFDELHKSLTRALSVTGGSPTAHTALGHLKEEADAAGKNTTKLLALLHEAAQEKLIVASDMKLNPTAKAIAQGELERFIHDLSSEVITLNVKLGPEVQNAINSAQPVPPVGWQQAYLKGTQSPAPPTLGWMSPGSAARTGSIGTQTNAIAGVTAALQLQKKAVSDLTIAELNHEKNQYDAVNRAGKGPGPFDIDYNRMREVETRFEQHQANLLAAKKAHGGGAAGDTEEDSKAKAARFKREKDQLRDTAKSWEEYAGNVSDSVEKALDAATKLRDGMRETIDPMKQQLISLGIIDDPLGPYVTAFEQGLVRLDARLKHFAAGAKRQLDFAGDKSDAAKKALNKMQGGDGELPDADRVAPGRSGSRGGGSLNLQIAEASMRMQTSGAARAFQGMCESLARTTVQKVTHEYDQYFSRSTAARTMRNFQRAGIGHPYQAGEPLSPGTLLYAGHSAGGAGHAMIVGPGGTFNDQRGPRRTPLVRPEWVVPTGSARGGIFPGLAENPGKDAEGRIKAILGGSFDASLSKIAAVPKAWGAAVRDTEGYQARFAMQTRLTSVEFQRYMQAIANAAGVSVDEVVKYFKQLANQTDYLANTKRAINATQDFSRDTDKQTRILRAGNDPLAELRERMAQGDLSKAPEADRLKAWTAAVRLETQKLDSAAKDYNETTRIEILGVRAGSQALREHNGNMMEAARATALVTEKEQFRRQLEKQPLTDVERQRRLDSHMNRFAQTYDDRQRGGTFSDYTQKAKQLQDAIAALNDETIQGAVDRELAAREDQRWMDPLEKADLRRLMIAEKMGELDKAHRDKMRELSRTGANIAFEGNLIGQGLPDRQVADQVQEHNAIQARYNELVDKGVDATKALAQARAEAFSDELNRRLQQANEQQQALNGFTRDAAAKLALQHDVAGVQAGNRIGSPDYEREIYRVTELNRLNEEYKKGSIGPVVNQMLDKSMQVYDAEHGTAAAGLFKQQLEALQRDMSILGDSTGLAALQFDLLYGQFSKIENKGQLLTDTLRNLRATMDLDTTRQLLGDASQERQRFIRSSRGKLDEELRTRDAGEQARVAAGGSSLPDAYRQAQGAEDERRRAAADLQDAHARLIHNLEMGRDIQLETARTERERVAIAQKYEALMRDVLGVTETQAEVQQDADERANARLKDRAETMRREADSFEHAAGEALYAGLTGQRDPIRNFFKSLWDDIARDGAQRLSHALRERLFGRAESAIAGKAGGDQGSGQSTMSRASELMGGIGSVPFFTPPFVPTPQQYPGAKGGGAIAQLAKQQLAHATIHVVNATSHVARATIHAPGAMIDAPGAGGGSSGGGGSSNSNEQIFSAVAQLWNT